LDMSISRNGATGFTLTGPQTKSFALSSLNGVRTTEPMTPAVPGDVGFAGVEYKNSFIGIII
jgi:hypothetical protein